MDLAKGIELAYSTQWSMINTFTVKITLRNYLANIIGTFDDEINLNIININTPDFTNQSIEQFIGNRWFIHNGRDELYRYSITFRDQNQMELYRKFYKIYQLSRENYFDDISFDIHIAKDADWQNEEEKIFMKLDNSMIENISNVSFNNTTENQIVEFTVNFKCTTPFVPQI